MNLVLKTAVKILSFIFSQKIFYYIEIFATIAQGKGFGDSSIKAECRACHRLLKKNTINNIFDIGAHLGEYTQELLKYYKNANFFLLEPNLLNYKKLKSKFKKYKNIKIFRYAISNENKKKILYTNRLGSSTASLNKISLNTNKIKEKINVIRFEPYLKKILKI